MNLDFYKVFEEYKDKIKYVILETKVNERQYIGIVTNNKSLIEDYFLYSNIEQRQTINIYYDDILIKSLAWDWKTILMRNNQYNYYIFSETMRLIDVIIYNCLVDELNKKDNQ